MLSVSATFFFFLAQFGLCEIWELLAFCGILFPHVLCPTHWATMLLCRLQYVFNPPRELVKMQVTGLAR